MESFYPVEEEGTNPDTPEWRVGTQGEPTVPADPLLHKRGTEAAKQTETKTEEPKDVHADGITLGSKWFQRRKGDTIPIGDGSKPLGDLLK
jgi:hypothetical protein